MVKKPTRCRKHPKARSITEGTQPILPGKEQKLEGQRPQTSPMSNDDRQLLNSFQKEHRDVPSYVFDANVTIVPQKDNPQQATSCVAVEFPKLSAKTKKREQTSQVVSGW